MSYTLYVHSLNVSSCEGNIYIDPMNGCAENLSPFCPVARFR